MTHSLNSLLTTVSSTTAWAWLRVSAIHCPLFRQCSFLRPSLSMSWCILQGVKLVNHASALDSSVGQRRGTAPPLSNTVGTPLPHDKKALVLEGYSTRGYL